MPSVEPEPEAAHPSAHVAALVESLGALPPATDEPGSLASAGLAELLELEGYDGPGLAMS